MMTTSCGEIKRLATLHVIVTCTSRKTSPVPARLHLNNIPGGTTAQRARAWISRLTEANSAPLIAAHDLYAGEHWVIARSLPGQAGGEQTRLWVCSAGYGLIPADAQIRPYAATFAAHQTDAVPGGSDGARRWWQAVSRWEGPSVGEARSISALADADPGARFLLVLSAPYLNACRDDIAAACEQVTDPDQFMIVSAGTRNPGRLAEVIVPADARLQARLGGTRQALNARIAAHLLGAGIRSRAETACHLALLLAEQPPIPRYERKKLSDQEILSLIADGLTRSPGASASRLLRESRDAGYACEQRRFSQLHQMLTKMKP